MRDPKRIAEFLGCLQEVWEKEPDLRFWQLMYILKPHDDPFYIEDDKALSLLKVKSRACKTVVYNHALSGSGTLMSVAEWVKNIYTKELVITGSYGNPVKDGKMCGDISIATHRYDRIPRDATHIMWYS